MNKATFVALLACLSVAQGCLTLYRDYGPSGPSFVMCSSGNVPANWNDQVSAIVVPAGWSATLWRDYGYSGPSLNIGEGTWSAPQGWNDQLSSLNIFPGCPVLFQDYALGGPSFSMCQSGDVPAEWNDRVSSIFVPSGWQLTLFRDYGFQGPSTTAQGGATWSAPNGWNDQLSSVKMTSIGCPVFFWDYNFSGAQLVMCNGGNVPANWNDQVSSLIVPTGWSITIYRDYGNSGPSVAFNAGSWNVPNGWNDQMSSFVVNKRPS